MKDIDLIQMAMGSKHPRKVSSSDLHGSKKRLDIHPGLPRGGAFTRPGRGLTDVTPMIRKIVRDTMAILEK